MRLLDRISPFLIGFGLAGLADGWNKVYAVVAAAGIMLYVSRRTE